MRRQLLFVLLVGSITFAQGPSATQTPAPTQPTEVGPGDPVITLHGFCPDKPAGTDKNSPGCETIITRENFEHVVDTLNPSMPPTAKQKLAGDYAQMLVFADKARKRGLDQSQHFNDLVEFLKLQLLSQELLRNLRDEAKPSPAEVEKYYHDNLSKYEERSLKRLYIPRNRHNETDAAQKPEDSKTPTEAELMAEGEKMRARLVAGADFDALQKEVYTSAGIKTPPPPTVLPHARRENLAPAEQQIFDLKQNEFSNVISEPAGVYIYEAGEKKQIPFGDVKEQIEATLAGERLSQSMNELRAGIKPEVNQAYFRSLMLQTPTPSSAIVPGTPRPPVKVQPPPGLEVPSKLK